MAGERSKSDPTQGRAKLNPGDQAKPGTPGTGENLCPDCGGSGRIGAAPCKTCAGSGRVIVGISGGLGRAAPQPAEPIEAGGLEAPDHAEQQEDVTPMIDVDLERLQQEDE